MEAAAAHQQKEKDPHVHRPYAFDKMEGLVREMQDPENGVPVRSQKQFLTSIPSAFMGYDLVEWLMERLAIEESVEAVHIANQLCQYGYFFPVNDSKTLTVKDDSSLYRFQTPYYWPWQHRTPDNVEYAIYLAKRTRRNKQRHALEDYEIEALNSLRRNLQNKWDIIQQQAEEQVRLSKERKKGDKIVSDSQERAFWRVYRPPPGCLSSLEVVPVPTRGRPGAPRPPPRKRTLADLQREVELLRNSLTRTRIKMSAAIENLKNHFETYTEYDPLIVAPQPSNPWVTDDQIFWQLNSPLVDVPTEKRVKRWALSMEEVMSDPTGLLEFTNYLRKEFSHENIRFWMAVKDLRRSFQAQINSKVNKIYEEFLAAGAPCEINIDGKTMEKVQQEMKNPTRFTFDAAAEHVYTQLLKKDCYPRFIRSEHYKQLLAAGVQPSQKKRFFVFGGPAKKKTSSTSAPGAGSLQQQSSSAAGTTGRRRGSDRSLSGSAHELAVCGVRDVTAVPRVPHSHSQSNLTDIPYRGDLACLVKIPARPSHSRIRDFQDAGGSGSAVARPTDDVCPWDAAPGPSSEVLIGDGVPSSSRVLGVVSAVEPQTVPEPPRISRKNSSQLDSGSSSSDVSAAIVEATERLRRSCGLQRAGAGGSVDRGDNSRPSVSSSEYFSPQRSFDLSHQTTDRLGVEETTSSSAAAVIATTSGTGGGGVVEQVQIAAQRRVSVLQAPLISISAIVGELNEEVEDHPVGKINVRESESDCEGEIAVVVVDDDGEGEGGGGGGGGGPQIIEEKSGIESQDEAAAEEETFDDDKKIKTMIKKNKKKQQQQQEKYEAPDAAAEILQLSKEAELSSAPASAPRIEFDDQEMAEEAQVVPVWEPDTQNQELPEAAAATVVATPSEQQDNNDNEVCPWEDEENCRVDATYVKTYSTLGYL